MAINTMTTTIYNVPDTAETHEPSDVEKISVWRLPKILWASSVLFAVNLAIVAAIAISPELNVSIYGEAAGDIVLAGAKPTPFVEPEPKRRPVRAAVKMTPIVEFSPEAAAMMDRELYNIPVRSTSLDMPRTSEGARITASPAAIPAVYRRQSAEEAISKQMDFPRMTASLMRNKTGAAQEVAPQKSMERDNRPAVIN